ncbi:MAG TPA: hypothetical protein VK961_05345, partial [Chthoniobacter sp.]|nr:hypothetical protein [Chthoniobacter sp.]
QSLVQSTEEPYLILCHQDIRLNPEHNIEQLTAALEHLDQVDPSWMVAGNAGFDFGGGHVLNLDDPGGCGRDKRLPRRVLSLDENLLILKAGTALKASADLEGFHLYGTDLCLNAFLAGGAAYVIDFLIIHLSPGNPNSQHYLDSLAAFKGKWRKHFTFCLVRTTCTQILLSRDPVVEMLLPRFGTVADFLWKVEEPLIPVPKFLPWLTTRLLAAIVTLGAACWYLFRRKQPDFVEVASPAIPEEPVCEVASN